MYDVADAPRRAVSKTAFKNMVGIFQHEKPTLPKGVTISDDDLAAAANAARNGGPFPAVFLKNDFFPDNKDVGEFTDKLLAHADPQDPPQFVVKRITVIGRQANGIATELVVGVQSGVDANGQPKFTYADANKIYAETITESGHTIASLASNINAGRSLTSVQSAYENWHETSSLPGAVAIYHGQDGKLVVEETPAARNTGTQVLHASGKLGIGVAMGIAAIGSDGLALSLIGFGAGTWGMGETAHEQAEAISDMAAHEQSLASAEGAAHIIGFAGSVTGMAPGVTRVGLTLAGVEQATVQTVTSTLNWLSVGVHGIGLGQQTYTAATSRKPLTLEQKLGLLTGFVMFGHSVLTLGAKPEIAPTRTRALDAPKVSSRRSSAAPSNESEPTATPARSAAEPTQPQPRTQAEPAPRRPVSEPVPAARPVTPPTGRVVWAGRAATLIDRMSELLKPFGDIAGKIKTDLAIWAEQRAAQGTPTTPRDVADKIAELAKAYGVPEINLRGLRNGLDGVLRSPNPQQPAHGVNFNNGPRNDETANPQQQRAVANGGPGSNTGPTAEPHVGPNVGPNGGRPVVPTNIRPGQTSAVGSSNNGSGNPTVPAAGAHPATPAAPVRPPAPHGAEAPAQPGRVRNPQGSSPPNSGRPASDEMTAAERANQRLRDHQATVRREEPPGESQNHHQQPPNGRPSAGRPNGEMTAAERANQRLREHQATVGREPPGDSQNHHQQPPNGARPQSFRPEGEFGALHDAVNNSTTSRPATGAHPATPPASVRPPAPATVHPAEPLPSPLPRRSRLGSDSDGSHAPEPEARSSSPRPGETPEQYRARQQMEDQHAQVLSRYPVRAALPDDELNALAATDPKKLGLQDLGRRLETLDKWKQYRALTPEQQAKVAQLRAATVAEINVKDTAEQLGKLRTTDLSRLDDQALAKRSAHLGDLAKTPGITAEQHVEIAKLKAETDAARRAAPARPATPPAPSAPPPPRPGETTASPAPGAPRSQRRPGETDEQYTARQDMEDRSAQVLSRHPVTAELSDHELDEMGKVDVRKLSMQELGARLETLDKWKQYRSLEPQNPRFTRQHAKAIVARRARLLDELRADTVAEINIRDTEGQLGKLRTVDVTKLDDQALAKRSAQLGDLAKNEHISAEQQVRFAG
jgi:hypothetical protein